MISNLPMFIAGEAVPSASGVTEDVLNPATGEPIARVPLGGKEDVDRAVAAADAAFWDWAETPPADRARALLRLADRVEEHAEEVASLESANVGKPLHIAREEVGFAVDNFRFFAGAARVLEGKAAGEYSRTHTSFIRRDPLGVVGSVAPWNFPLVMAAWKIGPALMTGNTLVLKPSEQTPLTALKLAELAADLFPEGVLNVVTGHGDTVGEAITQHPRVRMTSLTGDTATGKRVAVAASGNLKRLHLELGGKAPVLVFEDADIDLAIRKICEGGYGNSGQDCMAASRVYVAASIHDDFAAELAKAVGCVTMGDPRLPTTEMGPVISQAHRDRVAGFVDRAVEAGDGDLVVGGPADGPGFWYKPSLLVGAPQRGEIVQKEVFGPVVTTTPVADEDQAFAWANDVEYGLAASVFTSSVSRSMRAARRLQFGTVWINEHLPIVSEMPHGGFKQSGHGNDMSMYALEEYTEIKHVMVNLAEG
ncbi:gamma-aminobutyraldehyde dehydrogenase [Streptomyces melanosporofaciens]|uniref:Betaine-aldehyde dehydrogenase n=1 Tax=Streptomyces melanosporofaciens TaxID=67327 RepID=A0A1H4KGG1_STRMJ|nr:gamma-aminobutyraldehyde dehydrogenase [Streptomyces melanosporofaciens]SEB57557.1 betaine-aldehyde dehydrogenase [Streptomyces melanosporofaciens]